MFNIIKHVPIVRYFYIRFVTRHHHKKNWTQAERDGVNAKIAEWRERDRIARQKRKSKNSKS